MLPVLRTQSTLYHCSYHVASLLNSITHYRSIVHYASTTLIFCPWTHQDCSCPRAFALLLFFFLFFFFFLRFLIFLLNFLQYCFSFLCFGFCSRCICDFSSLTKDRTHTLYIRRRSLNHWTTRAVPCCYLCLEESPLT